ncbi:type I DNA topoisomerase [Planctomycetota bacterium]
MTQRLVIVESPAKGRTVNRFLGSDYVVRASMGHIRDLPSNAAQIPRAFKKEPWARLGVDVQNRFAPLYVVPDEKKKHVSALKKELKQADELLIATDEDREGESISWHLVQELKPKVPVKRMVFHEITREAILAALEKTRPINVNLVQAQEARRIVDRLFGYEVSPLLWKKVAPKLSAGRVQSVAIRMLVDRERDRMLFRPAEYWDLEARLQVSKGSFAATLLSVDGQRVATGRDFDANTGKLKSAKLLKLDAEQAQALAKKLEPVGFRVNNVDRKPYTRRPAPPFTTSTLQQEGGRKLGWSARRTMRTAQALYETGYITYMRTDSTSLSKQAVGAARLAVKTLYGDSFLSPAPRVFPTTVKNAQEAHEAIRPAGEDFRSPTLLKGKLGTDEHRLYELIWKRTIACQMADARGVRVAVKIEADGAIFQATGRTITFPGYLRAYVEGSDDPDAELADKETLLPEMEVGDPAQLLGLSCNEHRTQPPPRLTEAALVKALEGNGIGRPSTYASIIDTIERRDYTVKKGNTLVPTWIAFAVVKLLREHFPDLVDLDYTARMEDDLDAISRGEGESHNYLERFYFGGGDDRPGLHDQLAEKTASIDPREVCTIPLGKDDQDRDICVRIGRYGPYIERGEERANLPEELAPDELTIARAQELLDTPQGPRELGCHPESGEPVYVRNGRFGPFVQLGDSEKGKKPKSVSLLRGMTPESIDFETALELLKLPRLIGHDAAGVEITANLGRWGPYVKRGKDSRSLGSGDDVLTVGCDRALELLAQERRSGRQYSSSSSQAAPLRVFEQVSDLDGADLKLLSGRYGPYVTDGEYNASLPRGMDPGELTRERAVELIQERRARGPAKRSGKKRASSNKTNRKGSSAKPSAKKSGKKKPSAKKGSRKKAAPKAKKKTTRKKAQTIDKQATRKKATRKKATPKKAAKKTPD